MTSETGNLFRPTLLRQTSEFRYSKPELLKGGRVCVVIGCLARPVQRSSGCCLFSEHSSCHWNLAPWSLSACHPVTLVLPIALALLIGIAATRRGIAAAPPAPAERLVIDEAQAAAQGIRKLNGKHLTVYTDLPADSDVDQLPAVFDLAQATGSTAGTSVASGAWRLRQAGFSCERRLRRSGHSLTRPRSGHHE